MIQAKELRIGNYFTVSGKLIKATVEDIAKCQRSPALRRPIPLTPEILKKFGFEEQGWYNINEYEDEFIFSIRYQETDYKVCFVKTTYGGDIEQSIRFKDGHDIIYLKKPLQFVHHLQNLYLDFTGEEIIFN